MRVKFLLIILFVFTSVNLGFAQTEADDDDEWMDSLSAMSIKSEQTWETGKVMVVTASRVAETAQEAPANIVVLTSDDLDRLGVTTLAEALSYVPGITVMETYFGYTSVAFRGNLQTHYNNKSLFLINGHPSWEVINGSFHLEMIPLDAIKQVEVIRGPGSVLYGTNAYAGVINVITKKGEDKGASKISVKGGSFSSQETRFSYGTKAGDVDIYIAGTYATSDGYDFEMNVDEAGVRDTIEYQNDVSNVFGGIEFKGIKLDFGWFDQTREKVGLNPMLALGGPNDLESYFIDLGYSLDIGDNSNFKINLRYDDMDREYEVGLISGGLNLTSSGQKQGIELQYSYSFSDAFSFTVGASTDDYDADPYLFVVKSDGSNSRLSSWLTDLSNSEDAFYLQLTAKPLDALKVVAGARYTDNDASGDDTVPSIGLVYEMAEGKYLKVLYGNAFRSPNFFETSVSTAGVLMGKSDLTNETIETWDVGIDMALLETMSLKLNLFWLETSDAIVRGDANSDGTPDYINSDGHEIKGIEVDLSSKADGLSWFTNLAYKTGENADGSDVEYIAEITANAGLNIQLIEMLLLSANVQYVGDRDDNSSSVSIDAYTTVNLQLAIQAMDNLRVVLSARNLFDEEYSYPEYIRQNIDDIGNGPEQAFYAKVEFDF